MLAVREAQCGYYDAARSAVACRSRACPYCERRRAARLLERFDAIIETVAAKDRSYLVTTIRSVNRLADGWKLIDRTWSRFRRRPLLRGGRCRWRARDGSPGHKCDHRRPGWLHPGCRADRNCRRFRHLPVRGGVVAHEVTYHHDGMWMTDKEDREYLHRCPPECEGRARPWHPHLNVIMDAPFILQAEIADTWRALTCPDPVHQRRGYCPPECDLGSPLVWIEQVKPGTSRDTIKYVTKSADLISGDEPWPMAEFLLASRGRRMVRGFGSFFGVSFDEEESTEEQVVLVGEVIVSFNKDGVAREVRRRYHRPRYCPSCGRDTALPGGGCTWELPITVPRCELRLDRPALGGRRRHRLGPDSDDPTPEPDCASPLRSKRG
jgi:hypothetical protein